MKMKWTLADFTEMNDQFTFRLKKPEKGVCTKVSLDTAACNSFQGFVRQFGFHRARCALRVCARAGVQWVSTSMR